MAAFTPLFRKGFFAAVLLSAALPMPALPVAPTPAETGMWETWHNTMFQGAKVGFQYMRVEKTPTGHKVTARAALKLTVMGTAQDMSFSSEAFVRPDGALEKFTYLQTMQDQRQSINAVVKDGLIQMTVSGAGGASRVSVKAPAGVTLPHVAEYFFFQKLVAGKEGSYPVFLEAMRSVAPLRMKTVGARTVKRGGKTLEVFLVESEIQGMKTVTEVTPDGRPISGQSPIGISFQETTAEDAMKLTGADVPVTSLITFSLITPDRPVEDPDALKSIKLTIRGLSDPQIAKDARQTPGDPERVLGKDGGRTFNVPIAIKRQKAPAGVPIAAAGAAFPEDVKPDPEIQSDNKLMIKTAREIVGGEKNSWEAAKKINHWVFANLKKEFVDSFTAMDVLLSKRGECQSHTNLFVALARASGIPARPVGGIVYSKSNGGFLYHAWPEVYVGEWVAMDPTFGQETADPTHVKLIEGGVESLMGLMRFITKISITIESME